MNSILYFIKKHSFELLAITLGVISFLLIFGEILRPTYIDWIIMDGMDTYQHYYAWEFYRGQNIGYPFGIINNLGTPVGIPLIYMDAIPLFAFLFAPFSNILPTEFQYLGLFILTSFALNGLFGYKLLLHICRDKLIAIIGSAFFILSPIMIYRVAGHASLTAHWTILVAMWLTLQKYYTWRWLLLILLTILIHPYLTFMVTPIMLAHLFHRSVWLKEVPPFRAVSSFFIQFVAILFTAYSSGYFYSGTTDSGGFGLYSVNLNALWNPFWGDWSTILPNLPTGPYQFEGFAYLGLGILILLMYAVGSYFWYQQYKSLPHFIWQHWPYFAVGSIFLVLSISTHVLYGTQVILSLDNLPPWMNKLLGTVRSSGRFIWPIYYTLFLVAISSLKNVRKPMVYGLITVMLLLQIYDTSYHVWKFQDPRHENKIWFHELTLLLEENDREYSHLIFLPTYPWHNGILAKEDYSAYYEFAKTRGLTVNTAAQSRKIKGNNEHIRQQIRDIENGVFDYGAIYIILNTRKDLLNYFPQDAIKTISRGDATIVFPISP